MTTKNANKLFAKDRISLEKKMNIVVDYANALRVLEWLNENCLLDHENINCQLDDLAKQYAAFLSDDREFLEGVLKS